jgi:tripartite-type tricarboxylate transporter receptor subunit TctC
MRKTITSALVVAAMAVAATAQAADTKFFKGKNLTYIVATSAGGGYDAYARLIGRYLEKHLGVDNVLVKNIPGAGHIVGTNTLWRAKPNGLTIGTFNTGLIYGQILGTQTMQFDLREFEWIGKAAGEARSMVVGKDCPYQSIQEIMNAKQPVKFAAAGIGSASYTETKLLAEALDINAELIAGFSGNEGEMSMMRGEVCAQFGSTSSLQPFVDAGHGKFVLTVGGTLSDVPRAADVVKTERGKQIVSLIDALSQLGRLTAAPPETPKERVEALRDAYMAALQDPAFLAEAKKMGLPIEPARGDKVKELVVAALNQSPETVGIISRAVNVEVPTVTATGPLLSISDDKKVIEFMSGDQRITSKISGSRTKITIDGKKAKRNALEKGMNCVIEFNPTDAENEPVSISCRS